MDSTEVHVHTTQKHTNMAGLQSITMAIKSAIRSIQDLVDTGPYATLVGTDQDGNLTNKQPAHAEILVADNAASMPATSLGGLPCEGPATNSGHGHRNPPRHIPDFEKNHLFYLRPDFPHSWLSPAHSLCQNSNPSIFRNHDSLREVFKHHAPPQATELFFQPVVVLFIWLVESALISSAR